jgi:hypothetical protein
MLKSILEGVRKFKMQTLDFIGRNVCFRESRKVAMPLPSIHGSAEKHGPVLVSTVFPIRFPRRVPRPPEGVRFFERIS